LSSRQYCIVHDNVDTKLKNQLGKKLLKRGEISFFIHPGESIPNGIKNVHVLGDDGGLVIKANEDFDDNGTKRKAGDRWMIKGRTLKMFYFSNFEYGNLIQLFALSSLNRGELDTHFFLPRKYFP